MSTGLPSGTVTFLFTDIEGSSRLWEHHPDAMPAALADHDHLLRAAVEGHGGHVIKTTGDGLLAVFAAAAGALAGATDVQRALAARWPDGAPAPVIRVRMGLHSGESDQREGDYFGPALNRAARIMSIGHGGQVLLSAVTAQLLEGRLPPGVALRDLGEHRLRDLSRPERIFQAAVEGLPAAFPPLKTLDSLPGNLPIQLTEFVGRERELAEIRKLLATTRLLTLTGPGGSGKTRLSLQLAAAVQDQFAHGAWLVELAPLSDPALVPGAVAAAFGLVPEPGAPLMAALTNYLRARHLLLVLDNCEHLVEACARLAADLLAACARLTILASSREGLGVPGETTYHVPTLTLPDRTDRTAAAVCRYDAVDLFTQRARAARPGFAVTDDNAGTVSQIVRRLDGIPLAIELAAARMQLLSPAQIAARLDDRFRLLTGGSRTALPRQQTLRALIDWSYDLLSPDEAELFRRLGVFAGGWTLEAVEAVTGGDMLELLGELVDKSLVQVDETVAAPAPASVSVASDAPRYRYLETIRQYAREKLSESGEAEAVRESHLAYFERALAGAGLVRMESGRPALNFNWPVFLDMPEWIDSLEADADNIRAALDWVTGREPERALMLAVQFGLLASFSGDTSDSLRRVEDALAAIEALSPVAGEAAIRRVDLRALAYLVAGNFIRGQGGQQAAMANYLRAAELARQSGNRNLLARALAQSSLLAGFQGDIRTLEYGEEARALFRELDEPLGEAQVLGLMALARAAAGDLVEARALMEETKAAAARSKAPHTFAAIHIFAPITARTLGDTERAVAAFRESAAIMRRSRNRLFVTVMESNLGHLLRQTGRRSEALDLYRRSIREWQDRGSRPAVANMLENFAFIARAEGQLSRASRLLGAAAAIRDETGVDMMIREREEYDREVAALREALPPETLAVEWEAGRAMSLEAAVDFAVED